MEVSERLKVFGHALLRGGLTLGVICLIWTIDTLLGGRLIPLQRLLLFLFPYYVVWLLLTVVSIVRRGKPFRILWMGSMADEETLSTPNAPYAVAFICLSIVVLLIQGFGRLL